MKRILPLLALFVISLFTACTKEEPDIITLDTSTKTLYYKDTYQINATSKSAITYTVEDEYHATVSETGLITARCTGGTNIILSNGSDSKTIVLTISPKYHLYPEPNVHFGDSKSSIIAKYGQPDVQNGAYIRYNNYATAVNQIAFGFDDNENLSSYAMLLETVYATTLMEFLLERYVPVAESDGTFVFMNSLTTSAATMMIGTSSYNSSYWQVLYLPNERQ